MKQHKNDYGLSHILHVVQSIQGFRITRKTSRAVSHFMTRITASLSSTNPLICWDQAKKNKTALCDFSHLPHDNSIKLINTQPTESNSQCSPTRNHSAGYCYLNRVLLWRCLHSENRGIYKDPALSLHPVPRRADGIFCAAKNWGFKTQDAKSCCTAETSPEIKWNEKKKSIWNALPCQFESSREKKTLVRNHGLKSEY